MTGESKSELRRMAGVVKTLRDQLEPIIAATGADDEPTLREGYYGNPITVGTLLQGMSDSLYDIEDSIREVLSA